MWETYGLENEDLLWAGACFVGGIAGHQRATCGAVSSSVVSLGLRNRCSLADEEKVRQARMNAGREASELVRDVVEKFGSVICLDITGIDFSKPEEREKFKELKIMENVCDKIVQYVVEKLYELDGKRGAIKTPNG